VNQANRSGLAIARFGSRRWASDVDVPTSPFRFLQIADALLELRDRSLVTLYFAVEAPYGLCLRSV
jgi:hypothetical protein